MWSVALSETIKADDWADFFLERLRKEISEWSREPDAEIFDFKWFSEMRFPHGYLDLSMTDYADEIRELNKAKVHRLRLRTEDWTPAQRVRNWDFGPRKRVPKGQEDRVYWFRLGVDTVEALYD